MLVIMFTFFCHCEIEKFYLSTPVDFRKNRLRIEHPVTSVTLEHDLPTTVRRL